MLYPFPSGDDDSVDGGEVWTLKRCTEVDVEEHVQQNDIPTVEQTASMVNELFAWWRTDERLELSDLHSNLVRKIFLESITPVIPSPLKYFEHIVPALNIQNHIIKTLFRFATENGTCEMEDVIEKLRCVLRSILTAPQYYLHGFKMMKTLTTNYDNRELPTDVSDDINFMEDMQNYYNYSEHKLVAFQSALLELTHRLCPFQYKRCKGYFYKRVQTRSGFKTLAYNKHISIEQFVYENSAYDRDFLIFKKLEENGHSTARAINYLTTRVISEAPFLVENEDLRSFEGDEFGRGGGVYNCRSDMFFPYIMRDKWKEVAQEVQQLRRLLGYRSPDGSGEYVCTAPCVKEDVCLLHIDCVFPHCVLTETRQIVQSMLHTPIYRKPLETTFDVDAMMIAEEGSMLLPCRWRVALTQESKMPRARPIKDSELQDALLEELRRRESAAADGSTEDVGAVWYRVDRLMKREVLSNFTRVRQERMERMAESVEDFLFFPLSETRPSTFTRMSFLCAEEDVTENAELYIPLCTPALERPLLLSKELAARIWEAEKRNGIETAYVLVQKDGKDVYLRPCLGRNWHECSVPLLDQIFDCQHFTTYDKFFIKAHLGRTLFPVGDLDAYESTLMFEGEGGTGKSTILKIQMMLDPPHQLGIMSPNIEKQFGMSVLVNARCCYCAEVGTEMTLRQEEWQISVSGEVNTYAVKNKEPIKTAWKSQWIWAGNSKPPYNNDEQQVTRRTAGVRMNEPIKKRQTDITKRMQADLGMLLRAETLSYFLLLKMFGKTQPLSVVHRLPPAFLKYYNDGRREADPVLDFIKCGEYVREAAERDNAVPNMPLDEFRSLFEKYRMDNNVVKKWSAKMCVKAFRDCNIKLQNDVLLGVEEVGQSHLATMGGGGVSPM